MIVTCDYLIHSSFSPLVLSPSPLIPLFNGIPHVVIVLSQLMYKQHHVHVN